MNSHFEKVHTTNFYRTVQLRVNQVKVAQNSQKTIQGNFYNIRLKSFYPKVNWMSQNWALSEISRGNQILLISWDPSDKT